MKKNLEEIWDSILGYYGCPAHIFPGSSICRSGLCCLYCFEICNKICRGPCGVSGYTRSYLRRRFKSKKWKGYIDYTEGLRKPKEENK